MNKATRIEKIEKIKEGDVHGSIDIFWKDELKPMKVYKIPLDCLIYNRYNGRILSRTKSLERSRNEINVESKEGSNIIEKLLWESKPDRNKKTLISLKDHGQEKPGIITRDGLIIDGNRRAMLLKKSEKYDYFKAVILPVTFEENPLEIEKLETTYQMGEDEKLGYNPTEKYLKTKGLYKKLNNNNEYDEKNINSDAIKKISDWMGETETTIKEYISVMGTMDEYLEFLEYDGIYTQLDGREDPFINLTKWLLSFFGEESGKAFDGYKNSDVDDLKVIAYDYIRIKHEGKNFRYIAQGRKENHFFGNKNIWNDFKDFHFDNIQPIKDSEENINYDSENIEAHLNDRDTNFYKHTKNQHGKSFLDENIDTHYNRLRYNKAADEPEKLIKDAKRALESINQNHVAFSASNVKTQISDLSKNIDKMLKRSTNFFLNHINILLKSVDIDHSDISKEKLLEAIDQIKKTVFDMEKTAKRIK